MPDTSPATFREWFAVNLSEYADDIASHGADAGFPDISYVLDCVEIFDRYQDDIWLMLVERADNNDVSVPAFIATFVCVNMTDTVYGFKSLCVWFACEELARETADA